MGMQIRIKVVNDVVLIRGEIPTSGGVPLATDWVAVDGGSMETAVNDVLKDGKERYDKMRSGGSQ